MNINEVKLILTFLLQFLSFPDNEFFIIPISPSESFLLLTFYPPYFLNKLMVYHEFIFLFPTLPSLLTWEFKQLPRLMLAAQ